MEQQNAADAAPAPPAQPVRAWATPEKFSGERNADWTAWIGHFRLVADANNWAQNDRRRYFGLYLSGHALSYFQSLDEDTRQGPFRDLVAAFEQRFGDANFVATFRAELQSRRQTRGESLSDYAETLRKISRRAYPTVPGVVQDTLARDQFVSGLDSRDLRIHVRGSDPATLDDALRRAMHFQCILDADDKQPAPAAAQGLPTVCAVQQQPDMNLLLAKITALEEKMTALSVRSVQDTRRCYVCDSTMHFEVNCPHKDSSSRGAYRGRGRGSRGN